MSGGADRVPAGGYFENRRPDRDEHTRPAAPVESPVRPIRRRRAITAGRQLYHG